MFYAISHTYGDNAIDEEGDHIGSVKAFASKSERDLWVEQGNTFHSQAGARSALKLSDRRDRRAVSRFQLLQSLGVYLGEDE